MRAITTDTRSGLLNEQFIPDHVFMYIVKGSVCFFDGNQTHTFTEGECGIARKNRLIKFVLPDRDAPFEPVIFCFDTPFLQQFQEKHKLPRPAAPKTDEALIRLPETSLADDFIRSLKPYQRGVMELDEAFENLKYEELLVILLKTAPDLASILFDYDMPEKVNLEAFMHRNFRFNVPIDRFAYLTGRSLSAFKRDFKAIFHEAPNRWLIRKRLQEAYVLIGQHKRKPSDLYLELGFETHSHFSFSFRKQFGITPTELAERERQT
ncbi:helix-turn-helix domain-containing protein [Arsenicibacter rosenii]|uniref:HTH araC/xylS-type domain-containing protein n=1 Tax=Arsenicibacter rosenii TaxID=1750698 RepID=A0A1S2VFS5_9BACT|nr:AraC family transcriptional regulator [Arsenicibacter rosenii]OIN56748.1 hypothetical protein BLX24_23510 [Arsenicibacter rosenii]